MTTPWKLATAGIALVGATALTTSLTTAYLTRSSVSAQTGSHTDAARLAAGVQPSPRPAAASPSRYAEAAPIMTPAVRTASSAASTPPAPSVPAVVSAPPMLSTPPERPAMASAPVERPTTVASAPAECGTGGDRAWRIAKPGLLGTLVGAGLGAAGGAIADGGNGAGKGALIGGVAGAAVGSAYGAYNTKQECGTIFGGNGDGDTGGSSSVIRDRSETPQAALRQSAPSDTITIYRR
jgi:hypothetical protein